MINRRDESRRRNDLNDRSGGANHRFSGDSWDTGKVKDRPSRSDRTSSDHGSDSRHSDGAGGGHDRRYGDKGNHRGEVRKERSSGGNRKYGGDGGRYGNDRSNRSRDQDYDRGISVDTLVKESIIVKREPAANVVSPKEDETCVAADETITNDVKLNEEKEKTEEKEISLIKDDLNVKEILLAAAVAEQPTFVDSNVQSNCIVCHVHGPYDFFIQTPSSQKLAEELANELLFRADTFDKVEIIQKGDILAVMSPNQSAWYRCKIVDVERDDIEGEFIDYGNKTSVKEYRHLPDEIKSIPPLAMKCSLQLPDGIGGWSAAAILTFTEFVNKNYIFDVVLLNEGDLSIVELVTCDLTRVKITEELLKLCPAATPFNSKPATLATSPVAAAAVTNNIDDETVDVEQVQKDGDVVNEENIMTENSNVEKEEEEKEEDDDDDAKPPVKISSETIKSVPEIISDDNKKSRVLGSGRSTSVPCKSGRDTPSPVHKTKINTTSSGSATTTLPLNK